MDNLTKDLTYTEFYMRENELVHAPVETEMNFYECVKSGDLDAMNNAFIPLGGVGFGILSDDGLRNLKYHLVITIAFITRFCVEGGMERETAYNLSDLYIRRTDKAQTIAEVHELHRKAAVDFTKRMSRIKTENVYSKPVIQCFEYVYNHLNEKIRLEDIAAGLGLSAPYLSRLFHKETGTSLSCYINKKRIETAERMLLYSDYEAADIANFLAFSSHSHFIHAFKKETGYTPKEYRSKYYRTSEGIKGGVKITNAD